MGIQETKRAKLIGPIWTRQKLLQCRFMPEYAVTKKLIDGIGIQIGIDINHTDHMWCTDSSSVTNSLRGVRVWTRR